MKKPSEYWDRLSPNAKRLLAIGAGIGGVFLVAWMTSSVEPPKLTPGQKSQGIKRLLTDVDPRSVSLDAIAVRVEELEKTSRQINGKIDQLAEEIGRLRQSDEDKFKHWTQAERAQYERQMAELEKKIEETKTRAETLENDVKKEDEGQRNIEMPGVPSAGAPSVRPWAPPGQEATPVIPPRPQPSAGDDKTKTAASAPIIRLVGSEPKAKPDAAAREEKRATRIPAGSILSGVLINGLDAPTSQRARQDPQPVLVRLKHEAILPNRYRSDIRECFLIASGYGDMSSERAFLRSETLACISQDRKVMESRVKSYAVGEDGKVGIRGRLVSKQGRVLANAMIAGFAKGISQIFGRQQVPVVVTDFRNQAPFQSVFTPEAAQAAAIRGVGESLETLTRFYLEMAQNLFPVIEVDAGRKVEFIVNDGFVL